MKRNSTKQLSGRRLILPALAVLTFSFLAIPGSSEAGVRVRVQVNSPLISAILHSGGHGPGLNVKIHPRVRSYQITKVDRKIARKIARRTEYSKRDLLQLRRVGYSWNQIGRLLHLPSRLMRNILHQYQPRLGYGGHYDHDRYSNDWDYYERDDRRHGSKKRVVHHKCATR